MPDNTDIERTIFKLEIDGSAYVEGADKLTASTNKLSQAQEAANKKLKELEAQQASYKKQLQDTDTILKENEKETLELTKRLNDLKNAGKGATAEAKNLQKELKGIAINTKEFRIEQAALKKNLADTNTAIKVQSKELAAAEGASGKFSAGMSKVYSGLSKVANIIPGLGIGGLVALIAGPLVEAVTDWVLSMNKANDALKLLKANQQNLNDIMEAANKSAAKQITDLKILYQTATDANIPLKQRLDAVKALQQEFPEYFKNIKAETILNGEAEQQYKDLTAAILATAKATAAKAKLDELEAQRLDISFQKQKIINATNRELAAAQGTTGSGAQIVGGLGVGAASQGLTKKQAQDVIIARRDAALAIQNQNDQFLKQQEDFLIKFAGLTNVAKTIEDANNKKFKDKQEKQTKEAVKKNPVAQQNKQIEEDNERLKRILAYNLEVFRNWQKNVLADSKERSEKEKAEQAAMEAEYQKSLDAEQKAFHDFIVKKNKEWDKDPERKKHIDEVLQYADAVKNVADSVIQFWQEANEAESKALDRSIKLQETRVEAAQRIADRGNAEYLRAEEDRLTELNVKRENAARKQLGIDAALQASQILVGITGAVSKIAAVPFGAETIAEIAIIIGALATGFGLVKQIQGNQPKLFEGTSYLERNGAPIGRDTIPAYLNEGEAVIPTDKNKAYHPAISAIYDGTIPAEDLNAFVNTYHKLKPIPQPNYERIKEVAELKIGQDGKMSVLLSENNKKLDEHIELQRLTLSAMKKLGVSINLDKYGLAISQMEVIEEIKKSKHK